LTPSARIRGHARDESGQPLANIPVQLFLPTSGQAAVIETTSSADGSFDLVGFSPGVFVLVAGSPSAEQARSFAGPVVVATTDVLSQEVSLTGQNRYAVRGRITMKETN